MLKRIKPLLWFVILVPFLVVGSGLAVSSNHSDGGFVEQVVFKVANAAETPSAEFEWFPNRSGVKRAQIALGRAVTLRFVFHGKGLPDGARIKFGIPKKYVNMGIKVDPGEVTVKEGKASSKAIFAVPPGMPLGRFDVLIVAVNAETGKEIGRGKILIMLLPAGVGGC